MFIKMENGKVVDFDEIREFFIDRFYDGKLTSKELYQVRGKFKNGDIVTLSNISDVFDKTKNYKIKLEEALKVVSL